MARIQLEHVTKTYAGVRAITDVSLDIADGDLVVIVGPSGCGKTTTLRLIAGLETPSEGTIRMGDRVANDIPPQDRDVAMVFQNYGLYPHLTVYQNMAFALRLRKYPKDLVESRIREAAAFLGMEELLGRRPAALSGGERQRVALGRAMVRTPSVFLFDEPLSNLDPQLRASLRGELKSLHCRTRTTTVYVTHDQAEAVTLGNRIAVMYEGRVQQVGTPEEVLERPTNRFVAGFFCSTPMSFLEGVVQCEHETMRLVTKDGVIALPDEWRDQLHVCKGKVVVLGMRQRALSFVACGGGINTLEATVDSLERVGDRMDVCMITPSGQRMLSNAEWRSAFCVGQKVTVHIDVSFAQIFEQGPFGRNILLPRLP